MSSPSSSVVHEAPRPIRMRSRDLPPPTALTAPEFMAALWESRILPGEEMRRLSAEGTNGPRDGAAWANELMQRGLLTAFQVEQLLAGNGEHLVLGGYRILERLGEGGMGQVYRAEHQLMQRVVALKVIAGDPFPRIARSDYSSGFIEFCAYPPGGPRPSDSALLAFHREARAAGRLRHPNIITSHDAADDRGIHFLVMEYVPGIDLGRLVRESGPLPVGLACEFTRQAAVGLQYAYEQGVIHRDIKPSNLLLTWEGDNADRRATLAAGKGVVKVLDLGLARIEARSWEGDSASDLPEGGLCGTPDFMAPEIAEDSRIVDTRCDLYSLGCTLYYLLTGHAPFPGGTWTEKLLRHRLDPVTPPQKYRSDLPGAVVAILYRLLAKEPAQRYPVPADLAAALESWLATEESEPWPTVAPLMPVAVQTPDLMREGTWPSLDMVEVELPPASGPPPADARPTGQASLNRVGMTVWKIGICVGALSTSALLGLGLAWLAREWEDRAPSQSATSGTAISGAVPATALSAAAPAPRNAPPAPFEVRGSRYTQLATALESARDGDTVTIDGNGPYATEPLQLRDKAFTLQAAPGCRPRLRLTPSAGSRPWQALLTTNRSLTLVGLDLACPPADAPKAPREPMHLLYCEQATLRLVECRLSAPGVTAPIVLRNCSKVEMRGCKLAAAASGLCAEIGEGPACELILENNQITMEQPDGAAASLWSADGKHPLPPRLVLERNTCNAGRVLACTALPTGLEVTARGNQLTFDQAVVSLTRMTGSSAPPPFVWRGGDNTYQGAGDWLIVDGQPAGVRGFAAWRAYCGSDEPGSREP